MKKKSDLDIIIGLRPVIEAIDAGKNFSKVFIRKGLQGDLFHDCFRLIRHNRIPFQYVPVEKLNSFTRANHQGIVALISSIPYYDITQIIPSLYEDGKTPFILVLDGITDIRNFGAIARSAEAAGVNAILVGSKKAAIVNSDAIKTSAGALHRIPICREENLESAISFLQDSGIIVFGASEKADELYFNHNFTDPTAFVMGAEDNGISSTVLAKIDHLVRIPMSGTIASLNVSVATGILLFEAAKQRL